jgi:hypothetical protein
LVAKLGADQGPGVTSQSDTAVVAVGVGVAVASPVGVLVGVLGAWVAVFVAAVVGVLVGPVVAVPVAPIVGVLVGTPPPPPSSSPLQPAKGAARLASMNTRTQALRNLLIIMALFLQVFPADAIAYDERD